MTDGFGPAQKWSIFRLIDNFYRPDKTIFGPTDVAPHESDETNTLYTIHNMEFGISNVQMWAHNVGI